MSILKLDYQGLPVHADREAWFNATEIAAMFGKQPYEWLRLPETERYIQALCKREAEKQADSNTGKSRIIKSRFIKAKRGNAGGTWLHPKLAVAFARWCDIDFALWCDEQIEALISSGREWGKVRAQSSIGYQVMSEILQSKRQAEGKATLPHHYGNEALLCNAALTGQFKPLERDRLDKAGLSLLTRLEARNAALIGSGMGYRERKAALFDMAASYRHGMAAILRKRAA